MKRRRRRRRKRWRRRGKGREWRISSRWDFKKFSIWPEMRFLLPAPREFLCISEIYIPMIYRTTFFVYNNAAHCCTKRHRAVRFTTGKVETFRREISRLKIQEVPRGGRRGRCGGEGFFPFRILLHSYVQIVSEVTEGRLAGG